VFLALMLVAAVSVHLPNGFFTQNGGFEYNLVLAAGALSVAFTGPGALSVDGVMGLPLSGAGWGIAALLAGLVGGAAQLATRRQPVTG
jgi:putative oxidoreductase